MLVDAFSVLRKTDSRFQPAWAIVLRRAQRFAEVQERLIAPDGTFPSLGRSTTYRFGAFQALAQMALLRQLPDRLNPAQVRCALTAVIRRMIEAPGTFDENGWLQIGFCGHQPSLPRDTFPPAAFTWPAPDCCRWACLPRPFWSGAPARYTSQQLWSGQSLPADHALADVKNVEVPALPSRPTPLARPAPLMHFSEIIGPNNVSSCLAVAWGARVPIPNRDAVFGALAEHRFFVQASNVLINHTNGMRVWF